MYSRQTTIINPAGLHARPATQFVHKAKEFSSVITIENVTNSTKPVNAKSMMQILTLGCAKGVTVELSATGDDEQVAVDALVELIDSRFGE